MAKKALDISALKPDIKLLSKLAEIVVIAAKNSTIDGIPATDHQRLALLTSDPDVREWLEGMEKFR